MGKATGEFHGSSAIGSCVYLKELVLSQAVLDECTNQFPLWRGLAIVFLCDSRVMGFGLEKFAQLEAGLAEKGEIYH